MSENIRVTDKKRLLGAIGLAARAGKAIAGVPLICASLSSGGSKVPRLVISASDVSDNTKKRISDKCTFYGVRRIEIGLLADELASALGKGAPIGAVAITDDSFCRLIEQYLEAEN